MDAWFLEHVPNPQWVLSEVHRVGKPDALVELRYPHFSHKNSHSDLTHLHRGFGLKVFDHYDPSTEYGQKYQSYLNFGRNFPFEIEKIKPNYCSTKFAIPFRLSKIFGAEAYEEYLSNFLPIIDVETTLRVIKK